MSFDQRRDLADYAGLVVHETPNAWRIAFGDKVAWLPKTMVVVTEIKSAAGRACSVTMPEWLAKREGLI